MQILGFASCKLKQESDLKCDNFFHSVRSKKVKFWFIELCRSGKILHHRTESPRNTWSDRFPSEYKFFLPYKVSMLSEELLRSLKVKIAQFFCHIQFLVCHNLSLIEHLPYNHVLSQWSRDQIHFNINSNENNRKFLDFLSKAQWTFPSFSPLALMFAQVNWALAQGCRLCASSDPSTYSLTPKLFA